MSLAVVDSIVEAILQKGDFTDSSKVLPLEILEGIYAYAYRYYDMKKYKEALPLFTLLCSQQVQNSTYWMGLGGCYQQLFEYEKAVEAYSVAAVYGDAKNDPYPHYFAAECYLSLHLVDQALKAMKSAFAACGKRACFKALRNRLRYLHRSWNSLNKRVV